MLRDMPFRVVLDACVMLPQTLNNVVLTMAEAGLFAPVWSADLLDEVERNLVGERFGFLPPDSGGPSTGNCLIDGFSEPESAVLIRALCGVVSW